MIYEATEPQRVMEKFEECRYRLVEMADYERALDTQKFMYALSGFLYAFRTTAYRQIGVVRHRRGSQAGRDLRDKLWAHGSIGFLKDRSDLETHGNGPVIWQRYTVNVSSSMCGRWKHRLDRFADRYSRSRFESPSVEVTRSTQAVDWQFANRPENLIALCHDALSALEEFMRQSLAPVTPQVLAQSNTLSLSSPPVGPCFTLFGS
jgi:hypothetical protein